MIPHSKEAEKAREKVATGLGSHPSVPSSMYSNAVDVCSAQQTQATTNRVEIVTGSKSSFLVTSHIRLYLIQAHREIDSNRENRYSLSLCFPETEALQTSQRLCRRESHM